MKRKTDFCLIQHVKQNDIVAGVPDKFLQIEDSVDAFERAKSAEREVRIADATDAATFSPEQGLDDDVTA